METGYYHINIMFNDNNKIIATIVGVAGLILYAYLLFFADISPEKQKYTVLAAALGVLYPIASLSNNMYYSWNTGKVWGVGIASACLIIIIGLITKVETSDGLIYDLFNSISSQGYRYFYLLLLIVANIYPLVSEEDSIWTSAFAIGIMAPVIIASLLVLLAIIIAIFIFKAVSDADSSRSWSSGSTNTSDYSNNGTMRETPKTESYRPVEHVRQNHYEEKNDTPKNYVNNTDSTSQTRISFIPCQCCGKVYPSDYNWFVCDTCGYRICPFCIHTHSGRYSIGRGGNKCSQCQNGWLRVRR